MRAGTFLASPELAAGLTALLAFLVALGAGGGLLGPCLGLLAAALAFVAWRRRPYDAARLGFLLTHGGALLVLAGLWGPRRWILGAGAAFLALGLPWMFWLKPRLKPKKAPLPPAWQRIVLLGTRSLLLALGALLALRFLRGAPPPAGTLPAALLLVAALHVHHMKAWKGARAQAAGLAAWGLGLGLWAAGRWFR
jgi:hypothetical protein